jgi:hypothetical protein
VKGEGRPVPSGNAPAPATLATVGLGLFVIGLAIGVFQPLFVVGIGAGLVAGPTYAGLLFLLCIPIALVMLVLAFFGARWVTVPAFVGSAALAVGLLAGISTANGLSSLSAASRPVTPTPAGTEQSFPTSLKAHADVALSLDSASGFTSNPTTGGPDGTFGHWCISGPGSTDVLEVTAMDVVSADTSTLAADLHLERYPSPIDYGDSTVYPRLVLQLREPSGFTEFHWVGPVTIVASDGPTGTVAFDALVGNPSPPGYPSTLSGQLSWTCGAWSTP